MKDLIKSDIDDFEKMKSFLNSSQFQPNDVEDLIQVLLQTTNILVANKVAFHLNKFKDESILDALVEVIKKPENLNKRGKLIYCCDEYDCTRYFDFFVKIVLEESGESCINAIDVIGNMGGPFVEDQLSRAVTDLQFYINTNKADKIPYLKKLCKYLQSLLS